MVEVPLTPGVDGVAVFGYFFGEGVERRVFKCSEIKGENTFGGLRETEKIGERLVAKESK
eukprot:1178947-Prorocentrum_minimum.AAC.1